MLYANFNFNKQVAIDIIEISKNNWTSSKKAHLATRIILIKLWFIYNLTINVV